MHAQKLYFVTTLMLLLGSSSGKRYTLPQGWTAKTGDSEQLESAEGAGYFEVIHAEPQVPILSDNATFALCFFRFKNGTATYLSVMVGASFKSNISSSLNSNSTAAVIVWTANRDTPIYGFNATLKLGQQETMELVDSGGKAAWSPLDSTLQGVSGIEMHESGAFSLYDSHGNLTWSSFDDSRGCLALLEGQKLYQGQELWASKNSSTMETGNFVIKVDAAGVSFNVVYGDKTMEPYFQWNLWNSKQPNVPGACPSYETVLVLSSTVIRMFYERARGSGSETVDSSTKCGPDLSANLTGIVGSLNYLKIDQKGQLVLASLDVQQRVWQNTPVSVINIQVGPCFPMTCGPYSVCKATGECECLTNSSSKAGGGEQCSLPPEKPLPCNGLEKENHHFLNVSGGASYFANKFTAADKTTTLDDCWSLCLSNCSCKAFFYSSGSCFFMTTLRGSWSADSSTSAFLKIQNSELVFPKRRGKQVMIATGVGGGTMVILICIGLVGLYMWKKQASKIANVLATALQGSLHHYSYKELKAATSNLSSAIGKGGSGMVFEGILSDGTKVAVKQLHSPSQKEFITEVNSIGSVSHMNIVKLCGFCAEGSHRLLVYEFVENGSLDRWLFQEEKSKGILNWKTRFNVSLGVARALAYLHEESKQLIMHLDIKPENILLDEQFVPKLSDFGVSKLMVDREVSQGTTLLRGTPGYLAPEWLINCVATKKCDVYSYGMVLLELISGRRNYSPSASVNKMNDAEDDDTLRWYFPAWVVKKMREDRLHEVMDPRMMAEEEGPPPPEMDVQRLIRVALWCIQENPTRRPSMKTVVEMLEGHIETEEPPLAFHFALPSPGIITISTTGSSYTSR